MIGMKLIGKAFEDYAKCMIETEPTDTDLERADYATQLER